MVGIQITNKIGYKMHRGCAVMLRKEPLLVRPMSQQSRGYGYPKPWSYYKAI